MVESYYPKTYNEALDLLGQKDLMILAGGTDLMVKKRSWSNLPPKFEKDVMFVSGLGELAYIDRQGHNVHVGSTVTLEELMDHFHTPELLLDAVAIMASPAIRHSGTLAGNVVNASPAGDSLPVLYLLDANVVLESNKGIRHVAIEDFITGPGQSVINSDEMIKEIVVMDHHFNHKKYKKIGGRKADAISKICFCGAADIRKGEVKDFRMALGAVAPTIVRSKEIEQKVIGKTVEYVKQHSETIASMYEPLITPIDDQRSTAIYRKQTTMNLIIDFLKHL